MTCLTPDVEQEYTQSYFEPLFINKQVLQATLVAQESTRKPLIYNLSVSPESRSPSKAFNLIIYDAAGEDLALPSRVVNYSRFVLNTSAFIFTVDPLTLPIFEQFPHHMRALLQSQFQWTQGRRAADQLNRIISLVERYQNVPPGSRLPNIPIAVMLTKADLFRYAIEQSDGFAFMKNPRYDANVDLADVYTVDQEVRKLLELYLQRDLLVSIQRFKHVSFFATSATGEPPDESGYFHQVRPTRCLDPLLWILHQLGILKARA